MATIRYAAPADDDFLRGLCAVPDVRAAFLDPAPGGHAPDDTVNYIIELAGAPVGFLQCTPMHARHPFLAHVPDALRADLSGDRVHSVGYAVHPDWRGRRAATSALRAAVAWHRGMDPECGFYALADRDGASARVLGLCGFRRFHEPGPSGLWTYVYIYFFQDREQPLENARGVKRVVPGPLADLLHKGRGDFRDNLLGSDPQRHFCVRRLVVPPHCTDGNVVLPVRARHRVGDVVSPRFHETRKKRRVVATRDAPVRARPDDERVPGAEHDADLGQGHDAPHELVLDDLSPRVPHEPDYEQSVAFT